MDTRNRIQVVLELLDQIKRPTSGILALERAHEEYVILQFHNNLSKVALTDGPSGRLIQCLKDGGVWKIRMEF